MPHVTIAESSRRRATAQCRREADKKKTDLLLWFVSAVETDDGRINVARTDYSEMNGMPMGSDASTFSRDQARALIECLRRLL